MMWRWTEDLVSQGERPRIYALLEILMSMQAFTCTRSSHVVRFREQPSLGQKRLKCFVLDDDVPDC